MPDALGERLARLEEGQDYMREQLQAVHDEETRTRGRLHDLEKIAQGFLMAQREMHRANDARLRRITLTLQWGALAVAAAMLVLALVTAMNVGH